MIVRARLFPLAALVPMLVVACGGDLQLPATPEAAALHAEMDAADLSTAPTLTIPDLTEAGASTIVRTDRGISYRLATTDLPPGTAATLWFVVFNRPENCAGTPCEEPDLFVPDVRADVLYGAGRVVRGAGPTTFAGHRRLDDSDGSIFAALGLEAPGLEDARTAEIHLVVRSHGPVIPGRIAEMIRTFNGGCQHPGPEFPDPLPPELGAPGPNTCDDLRFAIHMP